ncbi:MAG: STN and carboxypeptidase regulatory-like domain-containing protein [Bacteroidales bacterium]
MNSPNKLGFRKRLNKIWILLFTMVVSFDIYAQETNDSLLNKSITIKIKNVSIYQALDKIGENANCYFIYDSKDVNNNKKAPSIDANSIPLQTILDQLISNPNITYKVIDRHILLYQKQIENKETIQHQPDSSGFFILGGKIFDKTTKSPIPFATVAIEKQGLGTISNFDGVFSIRIPKHLIKSNITISYLGYQNLVVPAELLKDKALNLYIQPRYIPIQEVFIRNIDAKGIVKSSIENKSSNYCDSDIYLTSFYREGVKRDNKYLSYAEAVFKVFKSAYTKGSGTDQVRLLKSRKLELQDRRDTLIFKLKAGIRGALDLDIVKSLPDFLDPEYMENYEYTKIDIVAYDSRSAYAIAFEQKPNISQPLYSGTLYIDVEKLTLLKAEFGINEKFVEKAANLFVLKKDKKIHVKPAEIKYTVEYRQWNDKYYIHHVRGDLSFRVRKRRQLFPDTFALFLEYVGIQIDSENVQRFSRRETLRPNIVFSDENYNYDSNFWGNLNIISPEEDINKALSKINPKIESISEDQP